jgi:hypothetical protein
MKNTDAKNLVFGGVLITSTAIGYMRGFGNGLLALGCITLVLGVIACIVIWADGL